MTYREIKDQAPPVLSTYQSVHDITILDMHQRKQLGLSRYGVALQPFNGRSALVDAYQEQLDHVVYLRQAIYELDMLLLAIDHVLEDGSLPDTASIRGLRELRALVGNPQGGAQS